MLRPRVALAILLSILTLALPVADAQVRGRSAGPAAGATAGRGGLPIAPSLVLQLIELGRQHVTPPDITRRSGRTTGTILVVRSNRQVIARESAAAADRGVAYAPSADV